MTVQDYHHYKGYHYDLKIASLYGSLIINKYIEIMDNHERAWTQDWKSRWNEVGILYIMLKYESVRHQPSKIEVAYTWESCLCLPS